MNALKKIRINQGLTQQEVSDKAQMSKQNYCRYEKMSNENLVDCKYRNLLLLADALNTTVDTIISTAEQER